MPAHASRGPLSCGQLSREDTVPRAHNAKPPSHVSPSRPRAPGNRFAQAVYGVVRSIPEGRVLSYGAVAALVGSPRAARGVGAALNALSPDSDVPWWRVVNRNGEVTIPAEMGMRALQRTLLEAEDVAFLPSGRIDLDRHAWCGPEEGTVDAGGPS